MKKIFITIIVLGALMTGTYIKASGSSNIPPAKPSTTTSVSFDNVHKGAKLYIKDSRGRTFYNDIIEVDGTYSKTFDLSALPEGDYFFEIDKNGFYIEYPFSLKGDNVRMKLDENTIIIKPSIRVENDLVYLSRLDTDKQNMEIDIYYDSQHLAHSEEISETGNLQRVYDFSESVSGSYLFNIWYEDRFHSEMIYVK